MAMRKTFRPAGEPTVPLAAQQSLTATTPAAAKWQSLTPLERWQELLLRGAIIVMAALWVYSPTYHGDWLWDDDALLTTNPVVQSGTLQGLAKLWIDPAGADYFPLSYSALWAQWMVFGLNPTGYHAVTILLHATGALLLWRLLVVMRLPGAWLAGLLFAIHPACVESVGWVSELKNTLSLPLFLIAAICFAKHDQAAHSSAPAAARLSTANHFWAVVFFLVAMLAKTSMVMFPVVLLLHAWWRRGRVTLRDLQAAAPFFLVSLILGLVTIHYQHNRAIGAEKMPVDDLFTLMGFFSRSAVAGMAILFYLWTTLWPFHLVPIYPRWEVQPPQPWQLLPWPILIAATAWLWRRRGTADNPSWERHALMAFGFFVLMLLPIIGFVTISYMRITWVADHFVYLPMIGPIALVAAGAATWFASLRSDLQISSLATASVLLVALAGASFRYAHAFAGEDSLWTRTLASNPNAWQAHNRLGARKFARGDIKGGFDHFENATRLRDDLGETHNNLGSALAAMGRPDEGIAQFKIASERQPEIPQFQLNLGNALLAAEKPEEAEATYRRLTERFPKMFQAWNNLGVVQVQLGKLDAGVDSLRRATELQPPLEDVKASLQAALRTAAERLAREGKFATAETVYRDLLRQSPTDIQLLTNRGVTLYQLGQKDEAIAIFRRVLEINPDATEAAESLAIATGDFQLLTKIGLRLLELGQKEGAIATLRKALEINPHATEAKEALANATRRAPAVAAPPPDAGVPASSTLAPPAILQ